LIRQDSRNARKFMLVEKLYCKPFVMFHILRELS